MYVRDESRTYTVRNRLLALSPRHTSLLFPRSGLAPRDPDSTLLACQRVIHRAGRLASQHSKADVLQNAVKAAALYKPASHPAFDYERSRLPCRFLAAKRSPIHETPSAARSGIVHLRKLQHPRSPTSQG